MLHEWTRFARGLKSEEVSLITYTHLFCKKVSERIRAKLTKEFWTFPGLNFLNGGVGIYTKAGMVPGPK